MEEEIRAVRAALCSPAYQQVIALIEVTRMSKNVQIAHLKRVEGNELFKKKYHSSFDHEVIFQKYSLCLALTDKESEEHAVAYSNRSASHFHLTKYEDCMSDISRAINITKSSLLKCKLLCREVECRVALGIPDAEKTLQKAKFWMNRSDEKQACMSHIQKAETAIKESDGRPRERKFFLNKTPSVEKCVNDFSSITVQYNTKYGNHVIALKDIQAGEVIFVERPYVTSLCLERAYFYCCHCFITSWTMIPCDGCSWCMFCSEKCKQEAWEEYHSIECVAYGYLNKNPSTDIDHLVQCPLRSVIIGVNQAGSIRNLRNELRAIDKEGYPDKFFENSKLKNTSFQNLYSLCSKVGFDQKQDSWFSDITLRLVIALAKHTNFFGKKFNTAECRNFATNEDVIFIASLIMKLIKICLVNGQSVVNKSIYSKVDGAWYQNLEQLTKGFSVSIISSLINHSCNPNVSRCFAENNNVIVYALQPIKKGSQIFECYLDGYCGTSNRMKLQGFHNTHYEIPKEVRQTILKTRGIRCVCEACARNWPPLKPVLKDMIKKKPGSYHKKLFKTPLEMKLFKTNKKIINLAECSEYAEYNPNMVSMLSKSIEEATNGAPSGDPPSIITWELITTLKRVFDRLYGCRLYIPNDSDLYE
ncbi:hypothetical protein QAD02_010703 [Eretmocerus hayati]|uniref:Uncharacterized protein n=1 Tax=Eretmocerus hayati TaxID=131215 RepID=A0ACC2NUV9_9HYME|nr:hypothetical protein QAD02_010703 [Eretmocerus hayati]